MNQDPAVLGAEEQAQRAEAAAALIGAQENIILDEALAVGGAEGQGQQAAAAAAAAAALIGPPANVGLIPLPVNAPPIKTQQILEILMWIGFNDPAARTRISEDSFELYDNIVDLTEKDIQNLSHSFASRTAANGRIIFGLRKTKRLKNLIHWVQDFGRCLLTANTTGYTQTTFLAALKLSGERNNVRKLMEQQSNVKSKAATPGPLKSEVEFHEWEPKLLNYLSTILGVAGIPLSYVPRDNEAPDRIGPFADFIEQTIAQAPLNGTNFDADRSTVHQIILSFTTGQLSETWVKPVIRQKNGRADVIALRDHFSGEGNTSRRIGRAEKLKETLHYKNESSMPFETFLTRCQEMFNIFKKYGEGLTPEAKIRFYFPK